MNTHEYMHTHGYTRLSVCRWWLFQPPPTATLQLPPHQEQHQSLWQSTQNILGETKLVVIDNDEPTYLDSAYSTEILNLMLCTQAPAAKYALFL